MNKLMDKLGISKTDIVVSAPARAKGKETTDSDKLRQVRLQMNNTFISHSELVNNATYFEPIYKRDGTHTATKFNVYKDTYLIDSNSLSITQVTNGNGKS
jgi:hypothetical protein